MARGVVLNLCRCLFSVGKQQFIEDKCARVSEGVTVYGEVAGGSRKLDRCIVFASKDAVRIQAHSASGCGIGKSKVVPITSFPGNHALVSRRGLRARENVEIRVIYCQGQLVRPSRPPSVLEEHVDSLRINGIGTVIPWRDPHLDRAIGQTQVSGAGIAEEDTRAGWPARG